MDNFNLKKYLAEGKLLKENVTKAYIWSHEDYYELYLTDNQGLKDATEVVGGGTEPEYITDVEPGMYQMISWNDEGPFATSYDSKLEFVKEVIVNYWGEDDFLEEFGIEELYDIDDSDEYFAAFYKHIEENLDKYYDKILKMSNDAYPDGDSGSGVVVLEKGKIVAGEANM